MQISSIKEINEERIIEMGRHFRITDKGIKARIASFEGFHKTPVEYYGPFLKYRDLRGYRYHNANLKFQKMTKIESPPIDIDEDDYSLIYVRLPNNRYFLWMDDVIKAEAYEMLRRSDPILDRFNGLIIEDKFGYLVDSLYTSGIHIRIGSGQGKHKPILLYEDYRSVESASKIIVETGDENELTIYHLVRGTNTLIMENLRLYIGKSTSLRHIYINDADDASVFLSRQDTIIDENSSVDCLATDFGGSITRGKRFNYITGEGASLNYKGLIFASKSQYSDLTNYIKHLGNDSRSHVDIRGALKNKSRVILKGMIEVDEGVSNIDSSLNEHTIIMDPGAHVDSLPGLEIKSSNVRVSHSAATLPLDQDMVYYLMSRGLDEKEASALIIKGFYRGLLERPLGDFRLLDVDRVIDDKLKH